jgi:hypothetical protein
MASRKGAKAQKILFSMLNGEVAICQRIDRIGAQLSIRLTVIVKLCAFAPLRDLLMEISLPRGN